MVTASAAPALNPTIAEIERLHFTWTEVAQFDLSALSPQRRVQVREPQHYAPKDAVERYAVQMKHSLFPPIVVTSDGWIVDGNTRVGAALANEQKFFPAIVLNVEYEGRSATAKHRDELHALAATMNAMNGTPLTPKEIRLIVEKFIHLNWKPEEIGRAIGLRPSSISLIRKEITAAEKLEKVGMDANGSLKGASLRALGSTNALNLNDAPYRALAKLAGDAGLNVAEINDAVGQARAKGSDVEQTQVLDTIRMEMSERIKAKELTGDVKPPASRKLRQHLGYVTKFVGREQELVETNPSAAETHRESLRVSISVLTAVLDLQGTVGS